MRTILKYNSQIGINTVMKHDTKICKCHGMSGSCSFSICYRRINPFEKIVEDLTREYHEAVQVQTDNEILHFSQMKYKENLVFFEDVIDFCPDTHGRQCKDPNNCATLCCSRGWETRIETYKSQCNCDWTKNVTLTLTCQQCDKNETIYVCN